jgi:hypothetical protein
MYSNDDGVVAALYSPCEVTTTVRNTAVHILEETEYPFRGSVRMKIQPATAVRFPLRLRIPAWVRGPAILVNGLPVDAPQDAGFAKIERTWKAGDVVELRLPAPPRLVKGYNDSISVMSGPLVFSFPIGESWVKLRDRRMTADWQVFPNTPWNYALAISEEDVQTHSVQEHPMGPSPFSLANTPVKLEVKARRLPSWLAVDGVADPVPHSPVLSSEPEEKITLVPYAAAKLRITAFPQLKS